VTAIALRPAVPADSEFCFQLHKVAMGGYVAATWGWDDAVQRGFHARAFDPGRWQIIIADGADAGMLDVEYRPAEIYLARIEIHPDHQGQGIGAGLIQELIEYARQRDQHLTLDVLTVNRRALAFYQRHGFQEIARHGTRHQDQDEVCRPSVGKLPALPDVGRPRRPVRSPARPEELGSLAGEPQELLARL
jgi:GNAT superfamily N-acetyltransferase